MVHESHSEVAEAGPELVLPEVSKTENHNLRHDYALPCCACWLRSSEILFYEYSWSPDFQDSVPAPHALYYPLHHTSDSSTSRQDEDSVIPMVGTGILAESVERPLLAEKVAVLGKLGKAPEESSLGGPRERAHGCSRREGMPSGTSDHQGEKARSIKGPSYSGAFSPGRRSGVGVGLGPLGVLRCAAARTQQNPSSPSTHALPWEQLGSPALGGVLHLFLWHLSPWHLLALKKHRLKTEHKEKGAIHFPAITSPTAVAILLTAHVDLFRSQFPCFWCRRP